MLTAPKRLDCAAARNHTGDLMGLAQRSAAAASVTALAVLTALLPQRAMAQSTYPTKPIRLIVGAPPGGGPDNVARIISQRINLGQPIVVENRTGASSLIAAESVAKAPADGHTLLVASQTVLAVAPLLSKTKSYDPYKDFTGVAFIGTAPLVLVAGPALRANTVLEIIDLAKSKPGAVDYGNGGVGTTPYMAGALFSVMTGAKLNSIPYPGEQAAITDIIGGRIPLMFANASAAMPHVTSSRLRAIAVTSASRVSVAQGVPTVAESGVPGFEIGTWLGVIAPAATPPEVVERINAEVRRVLALSDVKEKLHGQGYVLEDQTSAAFNQHIKHEQGKWSKLIQDASIKAE
jgi:tripartite-type tricarboxylate transporter receptor subunit TctC